MGYLDRLNTLVDKLNNAQQEKPGIDVFGEYELSLKNIIGEAVSFIEAQYGQDDQGIQIPIDQNKIFGDIKYYAEAAQNARNREEKTQALRAANKLEDAFAVYSLKDVPVSSFRKKP